MRAPSGPWEGGISQGCRARPLSEARTRLGRRQRTVPSAIWVGSLSSLPPQQTPEGHQYTVHGHQEGPLDRRGSPARSGGRGARQNPHCLPGLGLGGGFLPGRGRTPPGLRNLDSGRAQNRRWQRVETKGPRCLGRAPSQPSRSFPHLLQTSPIAAPPHRSLSTAFLPTPLASSASLSISAQDETRPQTARGSQAPQPLTHSSSAQSKVASGWRAPLGSFFLSCFPSIPVRLARDSWRRAQ